jgi:hypothetical protein
MRSDSTLLVFVRSGYRDLRMGWIPL